MSTQYKVFSKKGFAKRKNKPDKYVCYRTVLAHALQQKIRRTTKDEARKPF